MTIESPTNCENDTDGDGNCHLCFRNGGCRIYKMMQIAKPGMMARCNACKSKFKITEIKNHCNGPSFFDGISSWPHAIKDCELIS